MARRKTLKAKDIERLENTSSLSNQIPSLDCLTTATTFCCPTQGGLCGPTAFC